LKDKKIKKEVKVETESLTQMVMEDYSDGFSIDVDTPQVKKESIFSTDNMDHYETKIKNEDDNYMNNIEYDNVNEETGDEDMLIKMEDNSDITKENNNSSSKKLESFHFKNRKDFYNKGRSKIIKENEKKLRAEFLVDIKDREGRRPSDPSYDKTSLFIPDYEWKNFTPAKHLYWEIKKDRFDQIIFFQQGDFYNMFGPDADVGVQLGLQYNEDKDSVGVNRRDYQTWALKFASQGYKVTRVDQKKYC